MKICTLGYFSRRFQKSHQKFVLVSFWIPNSTLESRFQKISKMESKYSSKQKSDVIFEIYVKMNPRDIPIKKNSVRGVEYVKQTILVKTYDFQQIQDFSDVLSITCLSRQITNENILTSL